jgi:hypothetical protein
VLKNRELIAGTVPIVATGTSGVRLSSRRRGKKSRPPTASCTNWRTASEKAGGEAGRRLEPKAVSIKLTAATLRTPDDVELWLSATRDQILERLKEGPVTIH